MLRLFPVLLIVLFLSCITINTPASQEQKSPEIASFSANPSQIDAGGSSTLSWNITGAATVTIDQGIGVVQPSGSITVKPAKSTVYNLTASNTNGTKSSSVTINIKSNVVLLPPGARITPGLTNLPNIVAPKIEAFIGSPTVVLAGSSVTLFWFVSDAKSISIDNGIGAVKLSGTAIVKPSATTTYTITAENASGKSTKTLTIKVDTIKPIDKTIAIDLFKKVEPAVTAPIIVDFMATPETVYSDQLVALFWNVTGVSNVTIKLMCMDPYTMTPFDLPVYENLPANSSMSQDINSLYMWKKGLEQQWLTFELSASNQVASIKKEAKVLVTLR